MSKTIFDPASIACADEALARKLSQAGEAARKAGKVNLEIAVLARALKYTAAMFWPVGHAELEACESFAISVRDAIAEKYPAATRDLIGLDAASVREQVGEDSVALTRAFGAIDAFNVAYKQVLRDVRKYLIEMEGSLRNDNGDVIRLGGKKDNKNRASAVQTAIDKVARFDDAVRGWKQEGLRVTNDHWCAIEEEVTELKKVLSRLNKALSAAKDDKAEKAAASPAKFGDKA